MAEDKDLLDDASDNDPGDGAGNQADDDLDLDDLDEGGKEPKGKRTADNVRGELIRKLEAMEKKLADSQKQHEKQLKELTEALTGALPKPTAPKTSLDELTTKELDAMRDRVQSSGNAMLKAEFEKVYTTRVVQEAVNDALQRQTTENRSAELDKRTRQRINDKWGQAGIFDESTAFHKLANEKMLELKSLGLLNPMSMIGAIEEAADELDIQPQTGGNRRASNAVSRGGSSAPTGNKEKKHDEGKLEQAIQNMEKRRGKKFTPEQRKNMSEMFQAASSRKDLFITG